MQITRRSDYAVRILLELAKPDAAAPVSVRALADGQDVPYAFARSIQRDLVAAGLVVAHRGATGGLTLAKHPSEITARDVVEAVQGPVSCSVCTSDPDWCGRRERCHMHRVWEDADALLRDYLGSKTLAGLVSEQGK